MHTRMADYLTVKRKAPGVRRRLLAQGRRARWQKARIPRRYRIESSGRRGFLYQVMRAHRSVVLAATR